MEFIENDDSSSKNDIYYFSREIAKTRFSNCDDFYSCRLKAEFDDRHVEKEKLEVKLNKEPCTNHMQIISCDFTPAL